MGDYCSPPKKARYCLSLAQEGCTVDQKMWFDVSVPAADPRVHPKGYVKDTLYLEVNGRLTKALETIENLCADLTESHTQIRILRTRLNKIDDVLKS